MNRNRAFSLVELLVVVAIVAIVAALLFPVFSSARSSSKRVTCTSEMRQLLAAWNMYAADNGDTYVPRLIEIGGGTRTYDQLLKPYTKSDALWRCPEAKEPDPVRVRSIGPNRALATSYRLAGARPVSSSQIADVASTLLLVDDIALPAGSAPPPPVDWELTPNVIHACRAAVQVANSHPVHNDYANAMMRHAGRGNYGFADGSVRLLSIGEGIKPNVRWFAAAQPLAGFTASLATEADCEKIGVATPYPGRDPDTGN